MKRMIPALIIAASLPGTAITQDRIGTAVIELVGLQATHVNATAWAVEYRPCNETLCVRRR